VDHLLVHAQARDGGERRLAGIALEQRHGLIAVVELLDGLIDVDGAGAGLRHVAADAHGPGDQLPGLAHHGDFARRFQFRRAVGVGFEHANCCSRRMCEWACFRRLRRRLRKGGNAASGNTN